MEDKIYLIVYGYYSDWDVKGYFTNRDDAEKYCINKKDREYWVKEISSFDKMTGDFKEIKPKYEFEIIFHKAGGDYRVEEYFDWENRLKFYDEPYLRSNTIVNHGYEWIHFTINLTSRDLNKARKVAQDLLAHYMYMFDKKINEKNIKEFNKILAKDETDRKEKEKAEAIKEKELKELARLKAKYENENKNENENENIMYYPQVPGITPTVITPTVIKEE